MRPEWWTESNHSYCIGLHATAPCCSSLISTRDLTPLLNMPTPSQKHWFHNSRVQETQLQMTTRLSWVKKKKKKARKGWNRHTLYDRDTSSAFWVAHWSNMWRAAGKRSPRYLQLFWSLLWVNQHWVGDDTNSRDVWMSVCNRPPPTPFYI